jgi:hypothetical protein
MKKNIAMLGIVLVLSLLLASLVSADINVESADLIFDVSYDNLVDDEDELSISRQITITNNGNTTESLTFSLEGLNSDYDLTVSPSTLELSANGNSDITISGEIPVDQDQGEHNIGTLKITGAAQGDITETLKTDVEPMLEIKKIRVYVNDALEKSFDDNDEKINDLEPGDEVELRFQLKNLFDEDYDEGQIDGDIKLELDDSDYGDDIDLEEDFELEAGEKLDSDGQEIVFSFTIPNKVEEEDYNLEITVEGKDDNGAEYKIEWDLTLSVERRKDDVRIEEVTLTPGEVSCNREAVLTVKVTNFGSDKQKHAALSVFNTDLDINLNFPFELQRGTSDDPSELVTINLNVEDAVPGTYPLSVNAFYDYNVFEDKELVNLHVKKCVATSTVEQNTVEDNVEVTSEPEEEEEEVVVASTNRISSANVVKTVENPYTMEDVMVALIVIAMIMLFAMIILMLVVLLK